MTARLACRLTASCCSETSASVVAGWVAYMFTTRRMAVDRFLVVTPRRRTSSGSFGVAMATRFWTSTWAKSGLVPSLNVMVSCMPPSLVACDSMYSMPSTPLTSCSIGAATVSETVRASAPGYEAVTTTCGGTTSGYWAIGNWVSASRPARVISTESTAAKTGRV